MTPKPRVELVYDSDCPNVAAARGQLLHAFSAAGLLPHWREWRSDDPACPDRLRRRGSPAILVDGHDVGGMTPADGATCCRMYLQADGRLGGIPPVNQIAGALRSQSPAHRPGWTAVGAPALIVALLPKLVCPACWPAYGALATALGFTFLLDVRYLLPLTIAALALAVGALAWQRRCGYLPVFLAMIGSGAILLGKFSFESSIALYGGAALFTAAFIWNAWPKRNIAGQADCPACETPGKYDAHSGEIDEHQTQD